jgi:hypothetical protein
MIYYIEITDPSELDNVWTDPSVEHIIFTYHQRDIEECIQVNGIPYATYETLVVATGETYRWECIPLNGVKETHILNEGEYGKHPTLTSLTQAEFDAL